VGLRASKRLGEEIKSCPAGFETWIVQPVALSLYRPRNTGSSFVK
jgi:hypothetical protein